MKPLNLGRVGGVEILRKHKGSCHCGSVEFEVDLPDGLVDIRRCDCSLCRRRGAVVASASLADIHILKGEEHLKLYKFGTETAKHYFCSKCGVYTHHQRRSNPSQVGFNVACLEGINPLQINQVPTYDGVNHPADRELWGAMQYAGAEMSDLKEIKSLLEGSDLPASDCAAHLDNFIVAKEGGALVGVGGFEDCDGFGLLRSFVVLPEHRSRGVAEEIFEIVSSRAAQRGISAFYLLTTTARGYFERLGFVQCSRSECPEAIRQTRQFTELCPSTAVAMVRVL